jgi:hypothetical protein
MNYKRPKVKSGGGVDGFGICLLAQFVVQASRLQLASAGETPAPQCAIGYSGMPMAIPDATETREA